MLDLDESETFQQNIEPHDTDRVQHNRDCMMEVLLYWKIG